MLNKRDLITFLLVLVALSSATYAGYRTGHATMEVIKEQGCKITCPLPATSATNRSPSSRPL